jgi:multiple sugar transport system permease protein
MSFYKYDPMISPVRTFVGLANYGAIYESEILQISLKNTVIFTVASVGFEFIFSLFIALLLAGVTRAIRLVLTLLLMPMMIPDVVTTLGWKYIFSPQIGVLNYILGLQLPWLANGQWAMASVVIADVWKNMVYIWIILYAGLLSIPTDILESLEVEGASAWQKFRFVKFPLLVPFVFFALTVRTIDAFTKVFVVVQLLTGGGPGVATLMLPISIYNSAVGTFQWGSAAALSNVALLISLVFLLFYSIILMRGRQ